MTDFTGKRVLITGAGRGLGRQFAVDFAAAGARVAVNYSRSAAAAEEVVAAAAAAGGEAFCVGADITRSDQVAAMFEEITQRIGGLDILINNAGINGGARNQIFRKLQYEVYEDVLLTNTIAPLKMSEAFYDNLLAGQQKKIVTVSSSEGSIGSATQARLYFYRSSKAAVNMVMVNLALQLKRRGISVGMVNPGPTDTDFMAGLPKSMLRPPSDAVTDMIRNIDGLNLETTGTFWQYDGTTIPW